MPAQPLTEPRALIRLAALEELVQSKGACMSSARSLSATSGPMAFRSMRQRDFPRDLLAPRVNAQADGYYSAEY
jgi:hypothetical protein